jgi:acyl-CoA synthetase (NDP forming)
MLENFLNPDSIAIIGANDEYPKPASWLCSSIVASNYKGRIYHVHPTKKQVFNLKAYPSVKDIPAKVDVAQILVPARIVPKVMEECGEKGIKYVIVITSGFREIGEEDLEEEIKYVAKKWGIRFLGPNCIGFYNSAINLNVTSIPVFPQRGCLGIISQSGSAMCHNFVTAKRMGIGLSKTIHTGNEADIDCVDCLEYLGNDAETKVIGMCIEGIRRGKEFSEVTKEISKEKPIIIVKGGRTEAGARAARSHTSAIAGSREVNEALFRQVGLLQAQSMEELFDWALALINQPLPRGNHVGILTHSGGPGVLLADACLEAGLKVPELCQEGKERLKELLPPVVLPTNPLDLDFAANLSEIITPCLETLFQDPNIDAVIAYPFIGPSTIEGYQRIGESYFDRATEMWLEITDNFTAAAKRLGARYKKPILTASWLLKPDDPVVEMCVKAGIPIYLSPERAVGALAALVKYSAYKTTDRIVEE